MLGVCGCGASLSSRWSAGFPRRPWSRSRVCTPTNHPATICMYLFVYPKAFLSHSFRGFILREDRQECCESTSVNPFVSSDKARGADRQKTPAAQPRPRSSCPPNTNLRSRRPLRAISALSLCLHTNRRRRRPSFFIDLSPFFLASSRYRVPHKTQVNASKEQHPTDTTNTHHHLSHSSSTVALNRRQPRTPLRTANECIKTPRLFAPISPTPQLHSSIQSHGRDGTVQHPLQVRHV
jgi:hypothetical protein